MARSLVRVADIQATLQEQRYVSISPIVYWLGLKIIFFFKFYFMQNPIFATANERAGGIEAAQSFYV